MSVTFCKVFNDHFTSRSGVKDFVKIVVNVQEWFKFCEFTEASLWFGGFANKCKIAKSIFVISDMHKKLCELSESKRLAERAGKFSELTIHACEGAQLAQSVNWIDFSEGQCRYLDMILNIAGFAKSFIGFHKEYSQWNATQVEFTVKRPAIDWENCRVNDLEIEKIKGSREKTAWDSRQSFLKVMINTAYLAKAILGMALFYGVVGSAGLAGLVISTALTVSSLVEHFVKNLYIQPLNHF